MHKMSNEKGLLKIIENILLGNFFSNFYSYTLTLTVYLIVLYLQLYSNSSPYSVFIFSPLR